MCHQSFSIELPEFLNILDIIPLSDRQFANIFSYFIDCCFVLFTISFTGQLFTVFSSHFFIFTSTARVSGFVSSKTIAKTNVHHCSDDIISIKILAHWN